MRQQVKNIKEALRDSDRMYRTLFDMANDAIFVADAKTGILIDANKKAEMLLGLSLRKIIGMHQAKLHPRREIEHYKKLFRKDVRKGKGVIIDVILRGKGGIEIPIEISSTVMQLGDRKLILGIFRDVTERKKIEEILRYSEARHRSVVEDQVDLICRFKPDGRITFVNKAYCNYFGKKREELMGKSFMPLIVEDDRKKVAKRIASLSKKSPVARVEERVILPDGEVRWQQWIDRAIFNKNDRVVEYQAVGRDISEQKTIEEVRDNLIRGVSHTLKSPLAVMEMAYGSLRKGMKSEDAQRIKRSEKIMLDSLQKIRHDIDNILNMLVLSKHKHLAGKAKTYLRQTINKIIRNFTYIINENDFKIKIDIPKEAERIAVHPREAQILLSNIIDNAIKFTERGIIKIRSRLKQGLIEIRITDTGCGIIPRNRERVFDSFFKRHEALSGTGLGLTICREITNRYKGSIKVISGGKGKGTTVVVTLPKGGR
ncbi:PAS domain S-box protein [Candidatus Omnitrophota bacterium]